MPLVNVALPGKKSQMEFKEAPAGIDTSTPVAVVHLEGQISLLSLTLLDDFGGPACDESACEMAVRVLREQAEEIAGLRSLLDVSIQAKEIERLNADLVKRDDEIGRLEEMLSDETEAAN